MSRDPRDLRWVAAATTVVIAVVTLAALAYMLVDILLILFLGIVVAASLQPVHMRLVGWGVPKGPAVLLIYFLFLSGLILIGVMIGPIVFEQISGFVADLPAKYSSLRAYLQSGAIGPLRVLGQRLPPFERLPTALTEVSPDVYWGVLGVTTGVVGLLAYFVTVLAVAFYWTIEVPRLERLVLSLVPVAKRVRVLNTWHEIEYKLGAFVRGQGLAMLAVGALSLVGYLLIGLPNALGLAVLAGLLEAVPVIGPILGAVPALLVALPMGYNTVFMVIGFSVLVQAVENNILIPRIMAHAVGLSALGSILAVMAFGTLYGLFGVLIAIPIAAVIQVALEGIFFGPAEAEEESAAARASPFAALQARIRDIRTQARLRLRARDSRMGIDPDSSDHVIDAVDQQIEKAADQVEKIISVAEEISTPLPPEERAALVEELRQATDEIEEALGRLDRVAVEETRDPQSAPDDEALAELSKASGLVEHAVEKVESIVAEAEPQPQPQPQPKK